MEKAILAHRMQSMIAHLPDEKYKELVSSQSLLDSGVTVDDITNAKSLFGPNLPRLLGGMTRVKPSRVEVHHNPEFRETFISCTGLFL